MSGVLTTPDGLYRLRVDQTGKTHGEYIGKRFQGIPYTDSKRGDDQGRVMDPIYREGWSIQYLDDTGLIHIAYNPQFPGVREAIIESINLGKPDKKTGVKPESESADYHMISARCAEVSNCLAYLIASPVTHLDLETAFYAPLKPTKSKRSEGSRNLGDVLPDLARTASILAETYVPLGTTDF